MKRKSMFGIGFVLFLLIVVWALMHMGVVPRP